MDRFGDLKKKVDEQLKLPISVNTETIPIDTHRLLLKIKKRLEVCGHCNGVTYEDGVCLEHFTF
jgi:hypothetical protein